MWIKWSPHLQPLLWPRELSIPGTHILSSGVCVSSFCSVDMSLGRARLKTHGWDPINPVPGQVTWLRREGLGGETGLVEQQKPGCQWVIDLVNPLELFLASWQKLHHFLNKTHNVQISYSMYIFRQSQVPSYLEYMQCVYLQICKIQWNLIILFIFNWPVYFVEMFYPTVSLYTGFDLQ